MLILPSLLEDNMVAKLLENIFFPCAHAWEIKKKTKWMRRTSCFAFISAIFWHSTLTNQLWKDLNSWGWRTRTCRLLVPDFTHFQLWPILWQWMQNKKSSRVCLFSPVMCIHMHINCVCTAVNIINQCKVNDKKRLRCCPFSP